MADREQLYTALRNADAAGDTDAATKLAGYIQSLGPETESTPTPEKRGFLDELGHQAGLTARAGINGVAALPAMMSDAVTGPINVGLDAVRGEGNGFRFKRAGDALNGLMDAAGVAKPENATERVVQDATSAMAGAGSFVKAGQVIAKSGGAVAKGVGEALSAGSGLQVASGATGGAASGITRENGGGAGAQALAGLVGGMAPSLLPAAGAAAARGALRGGEAGRQSVADNIANFEAAGTTPTLGQATDSRFARATESLLAKAPGGAGVIAKRAQQQADEMSSAVQNISDSLAPGANATSAGEAITKGIGIFKDGFKAIQNGLYAKLDNYIPQGTPITADNTLAALADLNADIAGAPALSKWFKNARIQGIEGGLKSDTTSLEAVLSRPGMQQQVEQLQGQLEAQAAKTEALNADRLRLGVKNLDPVMSPDQIQDKVRDFLSQNVDSRLPYESLKKMRTLVGRELADNSLVADVPRSKWSALYGALSEDLGAAAKTAGPDAETAWNRANLYTSRSMEKLDQLKGIVSKDSPEKIFAAATSGTSEGATTITRLYNALPMDSRREVAAALLQKMGRATNGQQNALGDAFSSETFLTNLSKFSPQARATIFGRTGVEGLEDKLSQLAKVAESRRDGGKVFANPSGTAAATAHNVNVVSLISTMTAALLGHGLLPLAGAVAVPVGANLAARAMTRPGAAKFIASQTSLNAGSAAALLESSTRAGQTLEQGSRTPWRTPVSKRNVSSYLPQPSPRIELYGMAQDDKNPIAAIGSAQTVDEAISAAGAAIR